MTEGELLQLTTLGRSDISESQYLDIIQRKTGFLFSACCQVGGILGGANNEEQRALADYGLNLGIAFQLTDDLLDFTATEESLGKNSGADLLGGKVTLPLIHLIANRSEARAIVETIMEEGNYESHSREKLWELLVSAGGSDYARHLADDYASAARSALDNMPSTEFCDCLRAIPGYVLDRDR